jgi:hypothetical protein
MTSKRIEPTPFKPETIEPNQPAKAPKPNRSALVGLALAALLGLYGVFVWLPERVSQADYQVEPETQSKQPTASTPAAQNATETSAPEGLSPFEQAQLAQARKAAQDVLERLLLEQNALLDVEVNRWAEREYQAAIEQAKNGDQSYRARDFAAATSAYEDALSTLTDLSESIPSRVENLLTSVISDLENFELGSAQAQLELLDVLAPEQEQPEALRQRAKNNKAAKESLESAKAAAAHARWEEAKEHISQAVTLDPQHQAISAQAELIETGWQSWRFQTALSDVYRAIAQNDFQSAERGIKDAATYQGDAVALMQAKTQLQQARSTYRLSELAELAQSAVNREEWQLAKQYYEAALKIDPAVQYAVVGLPNAQGRAELHEKLAAVIAEPKRLEDIKVAKATEALIQSASLQPAPKAKLGQQIDAIQALLDAANQEIPVVLTSDGLTELTIVRHMRLGTIERLETQLRPGDYTFRGTRVGFKDILKTVRIAPNSTTLNLHIVCTETI